MDLSRREVIKLGVGAAACVGSAGFLEAAMAKKIPIGLQLYSLREQAPKDVAGTLEAVAKIGYAGVEFAGYYGRRADELKKLLDDNGLKCCGTHTGFNTLKSDAIQATIDFNKTLGNKFLIAPSLPGQATKDKAAIAETVKVFDQAAEKAKAEGLFVGYHAHGGDFRKIDGETIWDLLFGNTKAEVVMQLDVGNCLGGGGDPVAVLKKYPGRSKTIHIKEHGGAKGAAIGEGKVPWKEIFEICETTGGTEWYIVEHESYPDGVTPLECVKACLEGLKKMGK